MRPEVVDSNHCEVKRRHVALPGNDTGAQPSAGRIEKETFARHGVAARPR